SIITQRTALTCSGCAQLEQVKGSLDGQTLSLNFLHAKDSSAREFPSRKRGAGHRFSGRGQDLKPGVERASDRPRTATRFRPAAQAWTRRGLAWVPSGKVAPSDR